MSLDVKTVSAALPAAFPRSLLLPGFAATLFVGACPLIVEPAVPLWQQSRDGSFGLALLALWIAFCWVGYRSRTTAAPVTAEVAPRPSVAERLRWVAYAFVPSSLLLAVTAYITT